jgi:hypothetical protein
MHEFELVEFGQPTGDALDPADGGDTATHRIDPSR